MLMRLHRLLNVLRLDRLMRDAGAPKAFLLQTPTEQSYAPLAQDPDLDNPSQTPRRSSFIHILGFKPSQVCWKLVWTCICGVLLLGTYLVFRSLLNHDNVDHDSVHWSQYAYCQYVTNEAYLCNALMIFESLHRLHTKPDRLMMFPQQWSVNTDTTTGRLLNKAKDAYSVQLAPIQVQHFEGEQTWADSFTKLLAFNQTQYRRILSLDSDATVLQVRSD